MLQSRYVNTDVTYRHISVNTDVTIQVSVKTGVTIQVSVNTDIIALFLYTRHIQIFVHNYLKTVNIQLLIPLSDWCGTRL